MPTMRPAPGAPHVRGLPRAEPKTRAVEIQLEHGFEPGVISLGNRVAPGKSAHQMRQNVESAESSRNSFDQSLCWFRAGKSAETGT
jgi:hypothetical protein